MLTAIVRVALARPYTFVVMALMILIAGALSAFRMPSDMFPAIRIPVIAIAWTYTGLSPSDMAGRIIVPQERVLTTIVNDIEHTEGVALTGIGVIKVFLQPDADVRLANSQITAASQTILRQLPTNTTPPIILQYSASTVPILQLALSGQGLNEQQLFDSGVNFIRPRLVTVPGVAMPYPFGGKVRQIQMDLNPEAMQSRGVSALDISTALASQNQITPAGFVKLGGTQYNFRLNNTPGTPEQLNMLPVRTVNGAVIRMGEVAHVRDGYPPQTNIVHVEGQRSVLMSVLKSGATSTISIVEGVKKLLPEIQAGLPRALKITPINDQSIFVKAAVNGVIREGLIAALLTSLMILLFLGSWRSSLIVATSIPLSVMGAIALLDAAQQTFNVMTLGGLALAVGMLVDEATVTIENIERHLEMGKDVKTAILDGSQQIVVPAFLSLLCICIVFVPMFFLPGISGYLFVPLALAVIFSMVMSFILSRTLVPTMAMYLLKQHGHGQEQGHEQSQGEGDGNDSGQHNQNENQSQDHGQPAPAEDAPDAPPPKGIMGLFTRFQQGFEHYFERLRENYAGTLERALAVRGVFLLAFLGFALLSLLLVPFLGRNFFPTVDGGQIQLHVRAPVGTRIEETAALFQRIERRIRGLIPVDETASVTDNIGIPFSAINTVYSASGTIGPQDGDILIGLKEDHAPTAGYVTTIRRDLAREFPQETFSFLPADITSQILNFGSPAALDIQVSSAKSAVAREYAEKILKGIHGINGLVDARINQPPSYPELRFDIDRTRISQLGLTPQDVTSSVATSVAGTSQTAPLYWLNPENGVTYPIAVQMPEYRLNSLGALANIPVTATASSAAASASTSTTGTGSPLTGTGTSLATGLGATGTATSSGTGAGREGMPPQVLGALGTFSRGTTAPVEAQYNIRPSIDIYAGADGRDLGGVSGDIVDVIKKISEHMPKTVQVTVRGQYEAMTTAFKGLGFGLLGAIVLIYLMIVINFQSWTDPFIVIGALPAALAGICWMLFATGTPISVPALTGAIMCMGVATANSILVVTFARERLDEHGDPTKAALEAGETRIRPVLMTALAMIIGMAPMALGLGEGGEQNAPLGRAVIGGLLFATAASLFFVPTLFAFIHGRRAEKNKAAKSRPQGGHAPGDRRPSSSPSAPAPAGGATGQPAHA